MVDVVIIGGGPAGMTAGLYARRSGLDTLLIEHELIGGQASTTDQLANYPGFPGGIGGPELMMKFEEQAMSFGLNEAYEDVLSVTLDDDVKRVRTNLREIEAKAVILAMGAKRKKLGLSNEEKLVGRGISYCATCDGALFRGKKVAVVGGGNTAAEDVLFLAQYCDVILIHRRDTLRAQAHHVKKIRENPKIEIKWNTVIAAADQADNGLTLTLEDVKDGGAARADIACLFIAIGTEPNTQMLAGQVDLDEEGYVLAEENTKTSIPGVFVAGDLRRKPLKQVVTAVSDGAVAAYMAAQYLLT